MALVAIGKSLAMFDTQGLERSSNEYDNIIPSIVRGRQRQDAGYSRTSGDGVGVVPLLRFGSAGANRATS
jgi:hypothetical protein